MAPFLVADLSENYQLQSDILKLFVQHQFSAFQLVGSVSVGDDLTPFQPVPAEKPLAETPRRGRPPKITTTIVKTEPLVLTKEEKEPSKSTSEDPCTSTLPNASASPTEVVFDASGLFDVTPPAASTIAHLFGIKHEMGEEQDDGELDSQKESPPLDDERQEQERQRLQAATTLDNLIQAMMMQRQEEETPAGMQDVKGLTLGFDEASLRMARRRAYRAPNSKIKSECKMCANGKILSTGIAADLMRHAVSHMDASAFPQRYRCPKCAYETNNSARKCNHERLNCHVKLEDRMYTNDILHAEASRLFELCFPGSPQPKRTRIAKMKAPSQLALIQ